MGLLLLFLVHFHVFGSDLLDDEIESVLVLVDGLARAGELDNLGVLAGEPLAISLDHVVVRHGVEGLTQVDSQVDVGLLLHKHVTHTVFN